MQWFVLGHTKAQSLAVWVCILFASCKLAENRKKAKTRVTCAHLLDRQPVTRRSGRISWAPKKALSFPLLLFSLLLASSSSLSSSLVHFFLPLVPSSRRPFSFILCLALLLHVHIHSYTHWVVQWMWNLKYIHTHKYGSERETFQCLVDHFIASVHLPSSRERDTHSSAYVKHEGHF